MKYLPLSRGWRAEDASISKDTAFGVRPSLKSQLCCWLFALEQVPYPLSNGVLLHEVRSL